MKLESIIDLHGSPGYLLRRSGQLVTSTFDATLGQSGITAGQMTALLGIRLQPGLQQRELATLLSWDEATIGGMIKRLEVSGYVIRRSSIRSSRGMQIYISPKGEKFFSEIQPQILHVQRELLSALTKEEGQQLLYLLSKLLGVENAYHPIA